MHSCKQIRHSKTRITHWGHQNKQVSKSKYMSRKRTDDERSVTEIQKQKWRVKDFFTEDKQENEMKNKVLNWYALPKL